MKTCANGSCCWVSIIIGLVWLLASSGLLFLTWNKVIAAFTKVKQAKYWQALLLIATICALTLPCLYRGKCRSHSKSCSHHSAGEKDCPYSGDDKVEKQATKAEK